MRRELRLFDLMLQFRRSCYAVHGCNEDVTPAMDGFDVPRGVSIVIECRPDFPDAAVDALLEVDGRLTIPKFCADLLPRHKLAGVSSKQGEEFERLRPHSQERSRFSQLDAI